MRFKNDYLYLHVDEDSDADKSAAANSCAIVWEVQ